MILVPVFLRVPVPDEGSFDDMARAAVELVENCGVSIEGQRVPVTVMKPVVEEEAS